MSKYTEWEIRLKGHFANMKHKAHPKQAQGMLDLLDRELPIRKRTGIFWFTWVFSISLLVAIAVIFYTADDGGQQVFAVKDDVLLETKEVAEAKNGVDKTAASIAVHEKSNNQDDLTLVDGSNALRQESSESVNTYQQEHQQKQASTDHTLQAGETMSIWNAGIQVDKNRSHFAALEGEFLDEENTGTEVSTAAPDHKDAVEHSFELSEEIQAIHEAEQAKSQLSLSLPTQENAMDSSNNEWKASGLMTDSIAQTEAGSLEAAIGDSLTQSEAGSLVAAIADSPAPAEAGSLVVAIGDSLTQAEAGSLVAAIGDSLAPAEAGNLEAAIGDSIAAAEEDSMVTAIGDSLLMALDTIADEKEEQTVLKSAKKKFLKYELSAIGGLYQLSRTLEQEGTNELHYFRRDNEQPLMAYASGVKFNMIIKDHYLLSSGLNSLSLMESTSYPQVDFPEYEQYVEEEINGLKEIDFIDSFYVELNDEKLLVVDTQFIYRVETTYVQRTDTQITSYSFEKERIKIDYVSIPLQAGYRFYAGQRFSVDLYGGLGLNFLRNVQGNYWTLASDTAYTLPSERFDKFILSTSLGITTSYRIRKGLVIDLGTRFSYLPNASVPGSGTIQRYQLRGLQLGLSYHF